MPVASKEINIAGAGVFVVGGFPKLAASVAVHVTAGAICDAGGAGVAVIELRRWVAAVTVKPALITP